MTTDAILLNYPTIAALIMLSSGALYFSYMLLRKHPHFHWNLFMIAVGLLVMGFLIRLFGIFYPYWQVKAAVSASFALGAVVFALAACIAAGERK